MPPCPANFCIFVEMGFCHVGQAGLELLTSGDPPASASQSGDYRREPLSPARLYSFDITKIATATGFVHNRWNPIKLLFLKVINGRILAVSFSFLSLFFFETEFCSCCPGWSAMARSWLTTTSASWVQAILPQPPE